MNRLPRTAVGAACLALAAGAIARPLSGQAGLPLPEAVFDYQAAPPLDVREETSRSRERVPIRDLTFANLAGGRTGATLVTGTSSGLHAPILYVHWYDPEAPDSNRTQFLDEAVTLARSGATSLLIDTMWSDPPWFLARQPDDDYDNSVAQVKELRRALDVLLSRNNVDPGRLAYVGHDFGAMYGAVLAGVDRRVKAWCLIAGTTSFSDWYLLGRKLDQEARRAVVERLAPLDPVRYVGRAAPAPVLFQFATNDPYVPRERAEAFYAAARDPRTIRWYDGGHEMTPGARADRVRWLHGTLALQD